MMLWVLVILMVIVVLMVTTIMSYALVQNLKRARRYAVTLKNNEGAFIALCTKKRWDRWTFEDVRLTPNQPGGVVMQAAPGQLYVPFRNILYYQEIGDTANVTE